MKKLSYSSYKNIVMDTTDPQSGKKIALHIADCHVNKLKALYPLENMVGARFFIVYRKSKLGNGVLELDNLDEFGPVQVYAANHAWPLSTFGDRLVMVNLGHADLDVLVDFRPNKRKLAEYFKTVRCLPHEHYSGRPLDEIGV